jgi:hypothetical protein
MIVDLYTKATLTVIAACLVILVGKETATAAQAG